MKLIGAVMVLSGCLGMARLYVSQRRSRIRKLEELMALMERMEEEIRYGRMTLPECFLQAGAERDNSFAQRFSEIGRRAFASPQERFEDLLREGLEEALKEVLPATERELFYDFAAQRSFREEGMQARALWRSRKRIADLTQDLKAEHREKCRVALSLGAMGGLFLIVLLV